MKAAQGAVAAGHPVTAQAASEVLQEGGNAFDAALAAMITACVPEFVFSSIGGGGHFMAFEASTGKTRLVDFFAQTPKSRRAEGALDFQAITADFGRATQEFHIGAGSSAVPGMVQGFYAIHEALGSFPVKRLLEPAIIAAREGVQVSPLHAYLYTIVAPILTHSEGAQSHFTKDGRLFAAGDIYSNGDFAHLLEALAAEGPRLFSEGEIARAIVSQSESLGGHLTMDDLKSYGVELRLPLERDYRDQKIFLNPAPAASGAMIAFGLGLLGLMADAGGVFDALALARVMEESNRVRASRSDALHEAVSDKVLAEHFRALQRHSTASRGTTHISVVDGQGNAAGVTITNGEGNGHVVEGCGFMLNNMLGEEDLNPQGFHQWRADTRLSTMMAPTLMRGSDDTLSVLGSGGSNRIRTALLQVVTNLTNRSMGLEEAVGAARLHVERDGTVSLEEGPWGEFLDYAECSALKEAYPHAECWPERNLFFGGVHAVRRLPGGGFEAAGDPRRDGTAILV